MDTLPSLGSWEPPETQWEHMGHIPQDDKWSFTETKRFFSSFLNCSEKILVRWTLKYFWYGPGKLFIWDLSYIDCSHICSKRDILGFYKQATQRRPGDEHFFLLWGPPIMTGNGPKMVHFGPKIANHGRLVNVPKRSKRGQNGQPKCFRSFGSLLDSSGRLWIISDKNEFCAPNGQSRVWRRWSGAKNQFLFFDH